MAAIEESLDPASRCRIEQAERIIECMNKKRFAIFDQIEQLKLDRENVIWKLKDLKYRDRSFRYNSNDKREKLEPLKVALDRLNFNNNAYFDAHQIHLQLVHRSNSLAEERRLLKKAKKTQQKGAYCSSFEELSYSIVRLNFRAQCYSNDESQQRKIVEEIKELKWERDKTIANAPLDGRIWSSLGPKQTIQDNIHIIEEEVERTRKEHLAVRDEIKLLEKNLEAIEKKLISLQKQLTIANQRKGTAYQCILKLRK